MPACVPTHALHGLHNAGAYQRTYAGIMQAHTQHRRLHAIAHNAQAIAGKRIWNP